MDDLPDSVAAPGAAEAARYKSLGLEAIAKVANEEDRKPIQADLDALLVRG